MEEKEKKDVTEAEKEKTDVTEAEKEKTYVTEAKKEKTDEKEAEVEKEPKKKGGKEPKQKKKNGKEPKQEEEVKKEEKGMRADGLGHPIWFCRRRRYYIAIMAFWGYVMAYATRVNLSVAIIYLTELKNVTLKNGTVVQKRDFDWDKETQGLVLASFFVGYLFTQMLSGYLGGLWGGNHVLNMGVAGSGLVSFVGPVSIQFHISTAIIMRVVCGLLQGLTIPAINALWARWSPPLERTILSTIALSGAFFSSLLVMPICGVIGDHFGWEWTFYISGIASLIWSLIWGFTVFAGPEKDRFIKPSELKYIESTIGERTDQKPVHPWKKILKSLPVLAIIVAQTSNNYGFYTLLLYGPQYYFETLKYPMDEATVFTGIAFFVCGFVMQVFGHISDLMRRKGMKTVRVRKIFTLGGFIIQSSCMLLMFFIADRIICVVLSILTIGLGGITWAGFYVNALDIAPPHAGIVSGIANTGATMAGILCPLVASHLLPKTDANILDWKWIWGVCGVVYFFGGAFYAIFAEGEKQSWVYKAPEE